MYRNQITSIVLHITDREKMLLFHVAYRMRNMEKYERRDPQTLMNLCLYCAISTVLVSRFFVLFQVKLTLHFTIGKLWFKSDPVL